MFNFFRRLISREVNKFQKRSFSQCGEDLIVEFIFRELKIDHPVYLDVGAHHPYYLSNTALMYLNGCKGISVEPDPDLFKVIQRARPLETSLNAGVGLEGNTLADFYVMNFSTLNTFSKIEAERYAEYPDKFIKEIIRIPLLSLSDIIRSHLGNNAPNFLTIDVEGMDLAIIQSFDFSKWRPEVLCVETLSYTEDNSEVKLTDTIRHLESQGYLLYADTYVNSIFVDRLPWTKRGD